MIHDAMSGTAFAARFAHPLLRLNYDAGNVYSYSGSALQPGDDLAAAGTAAIGHLHLKDLSASGDGWGFCAIGAGLVDYPALMRHLPPTLPLSLELPLRLTRPGRDDPVRSAAPLPLPVLCATLKASLDALAGWERVKR